MLVKTEMWRDSVRIEVQSIAKPKSKFLGKIQMIQSLEMVCTKLKRNNFLGGDNISAHLDCKYDK